MLVLTREGACLCRCVQVDTTVLGLTPEEAQQKPFIASMGIYVFKKGVLGECGWIQLVMLRCFGWNVDSRGFTTIWRGGGLKFAEEWHEERFNSIVVCSTEGCTCE